MCYFAILRKMWGLLSTSHAIITYNENLLNKPYFRQPGRSLKTSRCHFDYLIHFYPVSTLTPSKKWHPTGRIGLLLIEINFFKYSNFLIQSDNDCLNTSETTYPLMSGLSCIFSLDCGNMIVL